VLDEPTNRARPGRDGRHATPHRRLAHGGQTVLLSSHLLDEVQEICDRVASINDGALMQESTVS
jgi:ABC-2 type transport system ATP-binding protein